MHTTWVVSAMTPTYRVKDPARRRSLPSSFEARSLPRNRAFCFSGGHAAAPSAGAPPTPLRSRSACSLTTCTGCGPTTSVPHPNTGKAPSIRSAALPHLGCAHAQAPAGPVCMCARAAACRVQRRTPGLRKPAASRVDTAEMAFLSCLVSSMDESAGLRSRRLDVRVVHEAPPHLDVAKRSKAATCKAAGVMPTSVRSRASSPSHHPVPLDFR